MINYWQNAGAFMPQDILNIDFYKSLYGKFYITWGLLGSRIFNLLFVPFLFGLFFLSKGKRDFLFLLVFPVILHLILSYFKLYPFDTRLILYLYPALLIIIPEFDT